jgi:plastocyanin
VKLVSVPGDPERPFGFRPEAVTVPVGSSVRWVNDDDVFHTITSTDSLSVRRPNGLFNKSLSRKGEAFTYTFSSPGTYRYYCQPHTDFMFGTVRVQ